MTERDIQAFNDSFERCMRDGGFFDVFYDTFLAKSDEIREKFARTDFPQQKRALRASLWLIVEASISRRPDFEGLRNVAIAHNRRNADICPELYEQWLDSLVETASRIDDHWDDGLDALWRQAFRPAIDYITSAY